MPGLRDRLTDAGYGLGWSVVCRLPEPWAAVRREGSNYRTRAMPRLSPIDPALLNRSSRRRLKAALWFKRE